MTQRGMQVAGFRICSHATAYPYKHTPHTHPHFNTHIHTQPHSATHTHRHNPMPWRRALPQVAKAPDGNGGLYRALATSGALAAIAAAGIEALDCYCVDNILARLGDPAFLGCCYSRKAQV